MNTKTYKQSTNKTAKRSKKDLTNKWLVLGIIVLIAFTGIIAVRISQASTALYSGRMPETGDPYMNYTVNIDGTVILKKSTNGETKTASSIDDAYTIGEQMYNEMLASLNIPTPPTATPLPSQNPTTSNNNNPLAPNNSSSTNTNSSTQGSSSNSSGTISSITTNTATNQTVLSKKDFYIKVKRKVVLKPILPPDISNVSSVKLYMDGYIFDESNKPPYSYLLDTTKLKNGKHALTAQVIDKTGAVTSSNDYTIVIENKNSFIEMLLMFFGY